MKRRSFISGLFAAVAALALPKRSGGLASYRVEYTASPVPPGYFECKGRGPFYAVDPYIKAGESALQQFRLHSNTYPRLAADLRVSPREICVHDPAGMLASCDVCGNRPLAEVPTFP